MPIDVLFTFAAAAFAVVLIPGPTVLLVSSYALAQGLRPALLCILGVCLGDLVAMSLTFLGLGAILATSASLFLILKWVGVAYLVYMGVQLWRAPPTSAKASELVPRRGKRVVLRAFLVNVFHPKGLAFYVAFLPQFIDTARPVLPQMVGLMAVFTAIVFSVLLGYALTAMRLRSVLSSANAQRLFNRTGASCLFGASAYTATLQQGG